MSAEQKKEMQAKLTEADLPTQFAKVNDVTVLSKILTMIAE